MPFTARSRGGLTASSFRHDRAAAAGRCKPPGSLSVDSESTGCAIEPRKNCQSGADDVRRVGRQHRPSRQGEAMVGPPGSDNRARWQGSPRNLGDPIDSVGKTAGEPSTKTLARGRRRRAQRERTRRTGGTARTSQTRRAGTMGSRSAPVVPRRPGNHPEGPGGGKRGAGNRGPSKEKKA